MKLRQLPEDFLVEEISNLQPGSQGEYSLYQLEKTGWTTPDALKVICKRWRLPIGRVSFGGLKDRHARSIQNFTILHGPARDLNQQQIQVRYLGKTAAPFTSRDIVANRFRLVVRSLSEAQVEEALPAVEEVGRDGVPNYFDDQRFGSVSEGEFVGKALVLGNFERAVWLALAAPYEHDRSAQKKEKVILREHWGSWETCLSRLPRGQSRRLVEFLAGHPIDYRGAIARLKPELRGLYLSAYQSDLWNRMLARWLRINLPLDRLFDVTLCLRPAPMYRQLEGRERSQLGELLLPLPTARGSLDPADPRTALMNAVLEEEGLRRDQLKVKGLREVFFSKGDRAALCRPAELSAEAADDELNAGRKKLTLSFQLPRGSYATLIVKRLLQGK